MSRLAILSLSILLTAFPLFARANSLKCESVFTRAPSAHAEGVTSRLDVSLPPIIKIYLDRKGSVIGEIDVVRRGEKAVKIRGLEIEKNFRGQGLGTMLFHELVRIIGKDHAYKTIFGIDNQSVFKTAYDRSLIEAPAISESDRNLIALHATPAWKQRLKVGLTKILRFSVDWPDYGFGQPKVELVVTGAD